MQRQNPNALILLACLIAAVVAFCVYIPSLGNGFVNWDDSEYIYGNPYIKGFDLKWAFTAVIGSTWIPLTLLSFALDYAVWGLDPFGFHLSNSILHTLNTFMLAFLSARLANWHGSLGPKGLFMTALAAGLLFGIHPIHVESVAWATERKDVLNAFFFLLGLHAYLSYSKALRPLWYILTLIFFVLSLLSKPMTVTMPLVLLIVDFYPLDRLKTAGFRKLVIEKLPFFGLSVLAGLISVWSQSLDAMTPIEGLPLLDRLHIALRGALFYVYKSIAPLGLAPLYPRDFETGINILFAAYAGSIAAITAFTFFMLRKTRAFFSAWAYYVVTLLPVIGILQVGRQAAADRYAYLPSMGLVLLAAAGTGYLVHRKGKALVPAACALMIISALLSFLTVKQTGVWKDSVSLWTQEIKVFPDYANGYVGRGVSRVFNGDFHEAAADLTRGIELKPGSKVLFDAYFHRGIALSSIGRIPEGIEDFTRALDFEPDKKGDYRPVYHNRAAAYTIAGEYVLALEDLRKAASFEPVDAESYTKLGLAYARTGDRENAYLNLQKAVQLGDNDALRHLKALEGR